MVPTVHSLPTTYQGENGTYCLLQFTSDHRPANRSCQIAELTECFMTKRGSHAKTFGGYLLLRVGLQVAMGSGFGLLDSTSMHLASMYDGHYNLIFVVRAVMEAVGPSVAGLLVQDSTDPNGEKIFY